MFSFSSNFSIGSSLPSIISLLSSVFITLVSFIISLFGDISFIIFSSPFSIVSIFSPFGFVSIIFLFITFPSLSFSSIVSFTVPSLYFSVFISSLFPLSNSFIFSSTTFSFSFSFDNFLDCFLKKF